MINDWQSVNKQFSMGWLLTSADAVAKVVRAFALKIVTLVKING